MDSLHCLHLQLGLEGKRVLDGRYLRQVKAVPGEDLPLMLLAQLADQQVVAYYDEALRVDLRPEVDECTQVIAFPNINELLAVLKSKGISTEAGHYKTYLFPPQLTNEIELDSMRYSKRDPKIEAFEFGGFEEQVYAIEQDGKIVSACASAREDEFCGEAWVYTHPEYRNRGFAQRVVKAWAQGLMQAGKVPFYSHKIENTASANLAGHLGLKPVFEEIVISYANV